MWSEVRNIPVCANAVAGNFLISRDVLGKWLGEKNRRWGKFLEKRQILHLCLWWLVLMIVELNRRSTNMYLVLANEYVFEPIKHTLKSMPIEHIFDPYVNHRCTIFLIDYSSVLEKKWFLNNKKKQNWLIIKVHLIDLFFFLLYLIIFNYE